MKYKIGDYVQVKINGSKQWRYIREMNFLNPYELEYKVSYEMTCFPKTWDSVLEKDIIKLQTSL